MVQESEIYRKYFPVFFFDRLQNAYNVFFGMKIHNKHTVYTVAVHCCSRDCIIYYRTREYVLAPSPSHLYVMPK